MNWNDRNGPRRRHVGHHFAVMLVHDSWKLRLHWRQQFDHLKNGDNSSPTFDTVDTGEPDVHGSGRSRPARRDGPMVSERKNLKVDGFEAECF